VLAGYLERPGRYFLTSGFTLVRITELLTNPFSLFYLLPNLKLLVLILFWDLKQKKLESVFPQDVVPTVATHDRVFLHYVPNSSIKHSKSDSKDRSQEIL
jgi:hypothetical protein